MHLDEFNMHELHFVLAGPEETPYSGGVCVASVSRASASEPLRCIDCQHFPFGLDISPSITNAETMRQHHVGCRLDSLLMQSAH
jgi:hypothetical protein